ncbi:MAG TPA: thioredoxin family protein [Thermoanaerobaculia bacterium]|jgi:thiol-disulfide isomerase/thioredoxin|nr:thioredoxin family protein [Thermoanaerobaculia bacterium]
MGKPSTSTIRLIASRPARVCASLALIAPLAAAAVVAQAPLFTPGGDLDLYVAGALDPNARTYESPANAAVLVVSDRLPSPVILHVRSRGVQAVPMARLQESGRGLLLQRGEALADLGSFELDKSDIKFSHGSVAAVLRPKPSLVGAHTLAELYEHTPKYKTDAAEYAPDPEIVDKLRSVGGDYHVKIVFGSWCHVCKQYLPRGLAVVEALSGAPIKFEYLGLPLEDPWNTPEVKRLAVKSLPTAIVYRGDQEIGRFAGAEDFNRPEARLWDAIARSQAK